ncbi:MAG: hypothetical protein QXP53_00655 [Candidatus Pacearchaeota archaeon]
MKSDPEKMKSLIVVIILTGLIVSVLVLNGCSSNNTDTLILKDKMIIPQDKCKFLDKYIFIHETGCPHCANVIPRIRQVEHEFNITFKEYNLAVKEDLDAINRLKILPQGVPCVIIDCKVYLGDRYSVDDFKQAILKNN